MRANRRRDTGPERRLRSELHRLGLRFRVDHPVRVAGHRPLRPDVVFPQKRVVVYVDGCWWHGCPTHWTKSRTNGEYWSSKITANRDRDARHRLLLEREGWVVVRFWEHEDMSTAARAVEAIVRRRESDRQD